MNTLHKKLFLLIGLLSPYSCSMSSQPSDPVGTIFNLGSAGLRLTGAGMSAVGSTSYDIARGTLSGARTLLGMPFYNAPFEVSFTVKKSRQKIASDTKPESYFSIEITPTLELNAVKDNAIRYTRNAFSDLFLNNTNKFTYDSMLSRTLKYNVELLNGTPYESSKEAIHTALINLELTLRDEYIKDLGALTEAKNVTLGTNTPTSQYWTGIYNCVADFALKIGILMPRVEKPLHYLLTHRLTRGIVMLGLLGTLGILAYQNREQIPSWERISGTTIGDITNKLSTGTSAAASQIGNTIGTGASAAASGTWSAVSSAGSALGKAGNKLSSWVFAPSAPVAPEQPANLTTMPQPTQAAPVPQTPVGGRISLSGTGVGRPKIYGPGMGLLKK
jgi:hypothetical protein